MEGFTRTEPPLSRAGCVGPVLYSPIANPCSMAEFKVECLTSAHRLARPVNSLTSTGYGLPSTATIPVRRLINIARPSRLKPRTSLTGSAAISTLKEIVHL